MLDDVDPDNGDVFWDNFFPVSLVLVFFTHGYTLFFCVLRRVFALCFRRQVFWR